MHLALPTYNCRTQCAWHCTVVVRSLGEHRRPAGFFAPGSCAGGGGGQKERGGGAENPGQTAPVRPGGLRPSTRRMRCPVTANNNWRLCWTAVLEQSEIWEPGSPGASPTDAGAADHLVHGPGAAEGGTAGRNGAPFRPAPAPRSPNWGEICSSPQAAWASTGAGAGDDRFHGPGAADGGTPPHFAISAAPHPDFPSSQTGGDFFVSPPARGLWPCTSLEVPRAAD